MIMRIWTGRTPLAKADAYLKLMCTLALPDYRGVDGCRGAWVTRRDEGDVATFQTISLWDNLAAVELFAGTPVDDARYYDFDDEFLLEKEPKVQHLQAWDS